MRLTIDVITSNNRPLCHPLVNVLCARGELFSSDDISIKYRPLFYPDVNVLGARGEQPCSDDISRKYRPLVFPDVNVLCARRAFPIDDISKKHRPLFFTRRKRAVRTKKRRPSNIDISINNRRADAVISFVMCSSISWNMVVPQRPRPSTVSGGATTLNSSREEPTRHLLCHELINLVESGRAANDTTPRYPSGSA